MCLDDFFANDLNPIVLHDELKKIEEQIIIKTIMLSSHFNSRVLRNA